MIAFKGKDYGCLFFKNMFTDAMLQWLTEWKGKDWWHPSKDWEKRRCILPGTGHICAVLLAWAECQTPSTEKDEI